MTSPTESSAPAKPSRRQVRRSRTIGFVAGFFIITLLLLAGYRAMVDTTLMSRYLFVVALHTNWALDKIGYSSSVEGDFNTRGREAEMRAELAAWMKGDWTPTGLPESGEDEAPITRWEFFQHRIYSNAALAARDQERLEALIALGPPPQTGTADDVLAFIEARIDALDDAYREAPQGSGASPSRRWGDTEAHRLFDEARREAAGLSTDMDFDELNSRVTNAVNKLEESRIKQLDYLTLSITRRGELGLGSGPLIHYVHSADTRRQLADAQRALSDLRAEDEDGRNEARIAQTETRVEELRAQLSDADATPATPDRSFQFRVIPECGAIQSISIFVAAVLAFPTLLWKRFAGVALGVPILYVINVIRLASLGVIGAYTDPETFKFFHEVVWQGIYIVFVVVVWLIWMETLVRRGPAKESKAP